MSTGISEQRVKGPGNQVNGPKDHGKIKERGPYETAWHPQVQQQPGFNNVITPEQYYQYPNVTPYQYPTPTAYNMGDRSWTNALEAVTYIGGYLPTPETYSQPNVYNAQYNHPNPAPGYNYYIAQKPYEGYYRAGDQVYGVPVNEQIKTVEQEIQALSVSNYRDTSNLQQKKVTTWASVAKQPVKPMISLTSVTKKKGPGMPPPPMIPGKNDGHWETKTVAKPPPPPVVQVQVPVVQAPVIQAPVVQAPVIQTPVVQAPVIQTPVVQAPVIVETKAQNWNDHRNASSYNPSVAEIPTHIPPPDHIRHVPPPPILMSSPPPTKAVTSPVEEKPKRKIIDELKMKNHYNPAEYSNPPEGSRFFVIKSYSEDDIHRSIKYEIWCSTDHGNRRLDQAFSSSEKKKIFLLYSVNGSGHFCGVAEMISAVDYNSSSSVWCQDKWKGQFGVRWIYVKDVPNTQLRHIRLENNENKSVTHSRDTQEVPYNQGVQVLRIIHSYKHETSIFDDFQHYENLQKLEDNKKSAAPLPPSSHSTINKHNQNGPIQFSSDNRPQHNYFNRDWESKQKPTKIEDMENFCHPQRLENFNHNSRSKNDNHRGRNENHNKEDNFREKGEHHRNHRSDQNKTRNDQHRNWDEHYRGGNNYNRGRKGRGGPSVFVNSNLKQARGNESKD